MSETDRSPPPLTPGQILAREVLAGLKRGAAKAFAEGAAAMVGSVAEDAEGALAVADAAVDLAKQKIHDLRQKARDAGAIPPPDRERKR